MLYKLTKRSVWGFLFVTSVGSALAFAGDEQASVQNCFRELIEDIGKEGGLLTSAQGHRVELRHDGHQQWRATVLENLPSSFSLKHQDVPVIFEGGMYPQCSNWYSTSFLRNHLHVLLRSDLPTNFAHEALVYIGSRGLKGGCKDCKDPTCQSGEKCFFDRIQAQDERFHEEREEIMGDFQDAVDQYCDDARDTIDSARHRSKHCVAYPVLRGVYNCGYSIVTGLFRADDEKAEESQKSSPLSLISVLSGMENSAEQLQIRLSSNEKMLFSGSSEKIRQENLLLEQAIKSLRQAQNDLQEVVEGMEKNDRHISKQQDSVKEKPSPSSTTLCPPGDDDVCVVQ